VHEGGDETLRELTEQIDGVQLTELRVGPEEMAEAVRRVPEELKQAMRLAAENIEKFHRAQQQQPVDVEIMPGVRCVQRSVPVQRVGLYIPGGSAPLFSTALMLAIPARVAGCPQIAICTPPDREGRAAAEIVCAAAMCGVEEIYKVGGAQAVAAMAYGTRSIRAVDKIFGPGNRYVTRAKQLVSDHVAIDMPAGPSEVMILADETAEARFVAADMLSQAEHGADSQAIAVVSSRALADRIEREVSAQLGSLSRRAVAVRALDNSRIVVMDSADDMIRFANGYAAEHLIISMRDPWAAAGRITAAGSIFTGNYSPESAGDYASGTNHTLPTCGWARSMSGVNLDSFVRRITCQELTREGLQRLGPTIVTMALAEGLDAHANAVKVRLS
jgi:histidinol dehydrogenase